VTSKTTDNTIGINALRQLETIIHAPIHRVEYSYCYLWLRSLWQENRSWRRREQVVIGELVIESLIDFA
jgi:hypothetical protein